MIRKAKISDVLAINHLRMQVKENVLIDSSWLTEERTIKAITAEGRGWVFEEDGELRGFSIAFDHDHSIWALFVMPGFEGRGIGRALLDAAVDWLWSRGAQTVRLSYTAKDGETYQLGTRADGFYRGQGWREVRRNEEGEVFFELTRRDSS